MLKFLYKNKSVKLVVEKDLVGFYLIVYEDPNAEKSSQDYLVDSLEEAFQEANEKFGVLRDQWTIDTT